MGASVDYRSPKLLCMRVRGVYVCVSLFTCLKTDIPASEVQQEPPREYPGTPGCDMAPSSPNNVIQPV